jgi:endonuclease YncB( thermonuclease family)
MQIIKFLMLSVLCVLAIEKDTLAKTSPENCDLNNCQFDRGSIPSEEPLELKFERVVDGDTFKAGGRKIRIWGIDAPEKGELGHMVAGWFLGSMIENQLLSCKFIYKDKYKRDVMQCQAEGVDIGSEMVRFGLAKDYKKYSGGYYEPEQDDAKKFKRGIWSVTK